jgi:hypothetical protein
VSPQRGGALAVIGSESDGGGSIIQPQQFYVSKAANASDSNNGELGTPFATIGRAITAAGSTPSQINVGVGTFTITAPDTHGNAISLTAIGTTLVGQGIGLTTIQVETGAFTWAIKSTVADCSVRDLLVQIVSGTCTYGVGVTCGSNQSAENNEFRNVYCYDSAGVLTSCFAVGPDNPGSGTMDLAGEEFWDCIAYGNGSTTVSGYWFGNGTTGNIVANEAHGCKSFECQNNVTLDACGISWFGGSWSATSQADILLKGPLGLDRYFFEGVRGDNGNVCLDANFSATDNGPHSGFTLRNCEFDQYSPNYHGSMVNILWFGYAGVLNLDGGAYSIAGSGAHMYVHGASPAAPATLIARGVFTDTLDGLPGPQDDLIRYYDGCVYPESGDNLPNPFATFVRDAGLAAGVNLIAVIANAGTIPITYGLSNFVNSSAATMAITMAVANAVDGQISVVRIYDFSAAAQTIGWTNTENSTVSVPTTSNGSTTLPKTVTFMFNGATSKWRCIASV